MCSSFTPTCFGKWLPSSVGRRCLISTRAMSLLRADTDYDPSSVASCCGIDTCVCV
jgi:hypothetical protein